jgi:hypothetical protein
MNPALGQHQVNRDGRHQCFLMNSTPDCMQCKCEDHAFFPFFGANNDVSGLGPIGTRRVVILADDLCANSAGGKFHALHHIAPDVLLKILRELL